MPSNRPLARLALAATLIPLMVGCATERDAPVAGMPAYGVVGAANTQIFENLGTHTRVVTTDSPEAQQWFDQGLNWLYAFNHDEAVRCFTRATELDPDCAMAWWGIAYAQGPNYNDPIMPESRNTAAWEAATTAERVLNNETAAERALVDAVLTRYAMPAPADRTELNAAFSNAMAQVWAAHPDDADVGTIYAESMMTQHPWMLYTPDERPAREQTHTIVATLERVLELDPSNPGANHLYIHAIEPSDDKERALEACARLDDYAPDAGHLLHMPSHIYVQVGMWERSIEQNAKAMEADDRYRERSPDQLLQHLYMVHNSHMLAFSAMMIGREEEALAAARQMWSDMSPETIANVAPVFDVWMCSVYDVLKRFGRWDELLAEPAPPENLPVTTAIWRAHRAVAYAAKKDFDAATAEHALYQAAMKDALAAPAWGDFSLTTKLLLSSDLFVQGEIALQQENWVDAVRLLQQAVAIEDTLGYGEPPLWLQPVRHTLGAVYMRTGDHVNAERVYREDLGKWPGNSWSLFGLARALDEQGKTDEAVAVRAAYQASLSGSDTIITTSCKCLPDL